LDNRDLRTLENPESIERDLFLEAVFRGYGYDFRQYSSASILRRIKAAMNKEGLPSISALQERVLRDHACMERFLSAVAVNVTSMFRDPPFYLAFRQQVIPRLRTYPFVRIWIAGCSTGEEVYSVAIILAEEGLYERARIYATDISPAVLESAREAIFPLAKMKEYTSNYLEAGGRREFSSYYQAQYDSAIFKTALKENLTFAQHNLASDASFNEFNVILCRNVMIYFNDELQSQVFRAFHDSLCMYGILGLGNKESLRHCPKVDAYEELSQEQRLFRRIR
jgi:chemotaxis protein methyltransferase CheR